MATSGPCDATHIREVIADSLPFRDWLVLDEFPLDAAKRSAGTPRIDILAIKVGNGGGYGKPLKRDAYEIKVDRRDFLNELKNPDKRKRAYAVSDAYWFAVPEGLITEDEVPPECGLISIHPKATVPCVEKMPRELNPGPPSPLFMMDVARRAYQVGRREGAESCPWDNFDLICGLAYVSSKNKSLQCERIEAVRKIARALATEQRHSEARELFRIANGHRPDW